MKKLSLLSATILSCLAALSVSAQTASITLTPLDDLAFGTFAHGSGGTITISPSGSRTLSGPMDVAPAPGGGVATFQVAGDPWTAYSLSLSPAVSLLHSSGTSSMTLDAFVSDPVGSGLLDATGRQLLSVGATLHVTANQAPGSYTGTFEITVNYQ